MKKAKLQFVLELPYQSKAYTPLTQLGTVKYSHEKKKYVWMFPVKKIREVLALLGRPFMFDAEDAELVKTYAEERKKVIMQGPKQGTGFIHVQVHPEKPHTFAVTTVREKQPQNTNVSFETVNALWRVIQRQPKGKKIKTGTVAMNYCNELKIVDFNTYKDGRFNWHYFSGFRKHYLLFYSAIKVLCHYEVVRHNIAASKSNIQRVADTWIMQTELSL